MCNELNEFPELSKFRKLIWICSCLLLSAAVVAVGLRWIGTAYTVQAYTVGPPFMDRSGTIGSGGTSQQLAAANDLRRRIIIQNPCSAADQGIATAENLYINFTSAATISGGNSISLTPCGSIDLGTPGAMSTEAITVIAATSGHKYVAKEIGQ